VVITGWAFTGATAVTFHGIEASFTVDSYHRITVVVPAGAITGRIRIVTPGGTVRTHHRFVVT